MEPAEHDRNFWESWYRKWRCRIDRLEMPAAATGPVKHRHQAVRASQVLTAWIRIEMPAMEAHYALPAWWLALSLDERRKQPQPKPIVEPRPAPHASSMKPGFSFDVVGPYLKLDDGTVFRERRPAARKLWRALRRNPGLAKVVDWLPKRSGPGDRPVKGRTAERILEALICRSLVEAGLSQAEAARTVIHWSAIKRNAIWHARENRAIWRELRIPGVAK